MLPMSNPIPNSIRGIVIGTWVLGLIWFENRRALRPVHQSKIRRDARNLTIAAAAGSVIQAVELPVAFALAELVQAKGWGLLPRAPLPALARSVAGILLLDYTLYWWHFLTHRVPVLWRFHQVHHLDLEMDATTALRFHFGEIAISILFRAAQIAVIGPTPGTVASWQVFLFLCILFHHSNVRLPIGLERKLARIFVTPRLHGIHHSIAPEQVNSNWSSGLTVWDWLHATLRTDTPQAEITMGVRGFLEEGQVTLGKALTLPFRGPAEVPNYDGLPVRQAFDKLA
jgi:sterol desaturase/sphingolipid hydroxylase (fatty acid hydroxylase superfamily)